MRFIKINYTLRNNNTMSVGIIADNRESAIKCLFEKQPNIKSVNSVFIGDEIHAIDSNVTDNLLRTTSMVKNLKDDIFRLKEYLLESDNTIAKLRDESLNVPKQTADINEISMLHEKIVQLEMEKMELEKGSSPVVQNTIEVDRLKGRIKELEAMINKTEPPLIQYTCEFCGETFDNEKGLKIHTSRKHKE